MTTATRTWREAQQEAVGVRGWAACSWRAIGTSVQLVATDPEGLPTAEAAVRRVVDQIDLVASRFRADSELSLVNDANGHVVQTSPLFRRALRLALDAAAWTDGLVDPTIGRSLVATGYDRTFQLVDRDGPPLRLTLRQAPGWQHVELNDTTGAVRVPAGAKLDLGATAKALAADLAAQAAAEAAGCGVLVSLGGDISIAGQPPGGGWPVRIADQADPELPHSEDGETIALLEGALATSGIRARRWRRGGVELHHIIDPRDGLPARTPWVTVSVLGASCALANTASTAAMILGPAAPAWLRERGLAALLKDNAGRLTRTRGWPA